MDNRQIIFVFALWVIPAYSNIELQGFIPQSIDTAFVSLELKKIYNRLAPDVSFAFKEPLGITFFFQKDMPQYTYVLPEWGGAGTIGEGHIIIPLDKKPFLNHSFSQILTHELVHVVIARLCKDIPIPRWFHEGCALLLSGEANSDEGVILSRALFLNSIVSLEEIDTVNAMSQYKAQLAYCQSRQAVLYLVETYGISVLSEIIQKTNENGSFENGLYASCALTPGELKRYYEKSMLQTHSKIFWLSDSWLLWIVITILFVIVSFITVIIRHNKMKLMTMQEEMNENRQDGEIPGKSVETPNDYLP